MFWRSTGDTPQFLAPEVIQTSALDCGPAALKCMLEGFGIHVSYGRLREACQTDIDGTSIDTLEDVAGELGLDAAQMMVPADHLMIPDAQSLPALVVTRLPDGQNHFVVVWGIHQRWVQVMDPGTGRRWVTQRRFLRELYVHEQPVDAGEWRAWAESTGFCEPLRCRLLRLDVTDAAVSQLLDRALAEPGWHALARLDAGTRMVDALVHAGGLMPGDEAEAVLIRICSSDESALYKTIPPQYWSVRSMPRNEDDDEMVLFKGIVLIQAFGRREVGAAEEPTQRLDPALAAAIHETPSPPERKILEMLKADGLLIPSVLIFSLLLAGGTVMVEALLFRGLLEVGQTLSFEHHIDAATALFVFLVAMLLLEYPLNAIELRMGRRLETRLRIALMEKIPRLGDRYFHSRLVSDMLHRVHEMRELRQLPQLGAEILRTGFQLLLVTVGLIWLSPSSAPIAVLALVITLGLAAASQPLLLERDLHLRTHDGALSRFYLDALLGLVPIRSHTAERSVRSQHESLLVKWASATVAFFRAETVLYFVSALVGVAFAVWLPFDYVAGGGASAGVLLLFYWALRLPALGQRLAFNLYQYPTQRSRLLRLMELLDAQQEVDAEVSDTPHRKVAGDDVPSGGIAIEMRGLSVRAGGHTLLHDINLSVRKGEHVAIVGESGAGKSSLVGTLLGWQKPAQGEVFVDSTLLEGQRLRTLRCETSWVDPAVQIWNRSLLDNLRYGAQLTTLEPVRDVVERANLLDVLERLPDGLQTVLGEAGGLVSAGEGQRVRLGRSLLRADTRLVILDEAFRGLEREQRISLLQQSREHWAEATLFYISHDVAETQTFDRVLVMEQGRIVEDAPPARLLAQDSRYRALLDAERVVRKELWSDASWRHLWIEDGELQERAPMDSDPQNPDLSNT